MIPGMGVGKIGQVIDLLAPQNFTWELRIRKLIVLDGLTGSDKMPYEVALTGGDHA
jgi:hypothetical protein